PPDRPRRRPSRPHPAKGDPLAATHGSTPANKPSLSKTALPRRPACGASPRERKEPKGPLVSRFGRDRKISPSTSTFVMRFFALFWPLNPATANRRTKLVKAQKVSRQKDARRRFSLSGGRQNSSRSGDASVFGRRNGSLCFPGA